MPVDVHRCSRNDVAHRFVVQMSPVDERPADGVNKLLPYEVMEQAGKRRNDRRACMLASQLTMQPKEKRQRTAGLIGRLCGQIRVFAAVGVDKTTNLNVQAILSVKTQ